MLSVTTVDQWMATYGTRRLIKGCGCRPSKVEVLLFPSTRLVKVPPFNFHLFSIPFKSRKILPKHTGTLFPSEVVLDGLSEINHLNRTTPIQFELIYPCNSLELQSRVSLIELRERCQSRQKQANLMGSNLITLIDPFLVRNY